MNPEPNNILPFQTPADGVLQTAQVVSISDKGIIISISGIELTAKVAFSCLVQPLVSDIVLWTPSETEGNYILAIASRPDSQDMDLAFPANTTMHSAEGSINILSKQSVTLAAGKNLTCLAEKTVHKSQQTLIDYEKVTAKGSNLDVSFNNIRLFSDMLNTMAKQVMMKAKNYFRHTEDYDEIKAKQMTRSAKGVYSVDSKYTVMVSKKDTKIDGERIHMG